MSKNEEKDTYEVAKQHLKELIDNPDTPKEVIKEALTRVSGETGISIPALKALFQRKDDD